MAGNIFINYRRDDSSGVAGRLHDSLAPKFGRDKLFMDVDNIPVGRDFEDYSTRRSLISTSPFESIPCTPSPLGTGAWFMRILKTTKIAPWPNYAIRLDPTYAAAFNTRGFQYVKKGDYNRAMADYNEAIRLDPKFALALCNRGLLKRKIDDSSGNADVAQAKQLDASVC